MKNPLIDYPLKSNDDFVPFEKIRSEHFEPAIEVALKEARKNISRIVENREAPTFENTIEALENRSPELDHIFSVFNNLKSAHTNTKLNRIAEEIAPRLAEFENDVLLNDRLFERVKTVFDREAVFLDGERQRLLEMAYKMFTRNGALLDALGKSRIREIDKKLAILSKKFGKNLLDATNAYQLVITKEDDLAGMPKHSRIAAREEAESQGIDGWVFTLKGPSVRSFLRFSDNEMLRRQVYLASASRGMFGMTDNRNIILDIVSLRDERAKLLGYEDHVSYTLDNRMVKGKKTLEDFLSSLRAASQEKAVQEIDLLGRYKKEVFGSSTVNPWDISYLMEKLQQKVYYFNSDDLRPYFDLKMVIGGVFEHAKRLYGLNVKKRDDVPVYHEDVSVYEVTHEGGTLAGFLYFDLFPRETKRGGAWIDAIRMQKKTGAIDIRPHLLIVCNVTKPTASLPTLLNYSEVLTIFHEFGHALHCLLSDCTYASLAGFNVLGDFVEFPSQLMECWIREKEGLTIFARHHQTGELIPTDLIEKIKETRNFMAGIRMLLQVADAALDIAWHQAGSQADDVELFEIESMKPYALLPHHPGTARSTNFSHIFDGGYDVGYYSYHWAEVLAADTFEYFKEHGIFSRDLATQFKLNVLSRGNSEEPMNLYKKFRGREPNPETLLRSRGLM